MTRATHKQKYLPFTGWRKWKLAGFPVRKFPRRKYTPMKHEDPIEPETLIVPPDFWYGLFVVLLTIVVFGTILLVLLFVIH